jgi:hypothetical protein
MAFGPAYIVGRQVHSEWAIGYDLNFNVRLYRPPVNVTLQVTDRSGATASVTRTVKFANPEEQVVVAYHHEFDNEYLDPDFNNPIGIVVGPAKPCKSRSTLSRDGLRTLKLSPAVLGAQAAVLDLSASTITVEIPCRYRALGCDGVLALTAGFAQARGARKATRLPKATVGVAAFSARPGRRSATARIKLNAYGRSLARAHKLRKVTLLLRSAGVTGKIVKTSGTVRLRRRG